MTLVITLGDIILLVFLLVAMWLSILMALLLFLSKPKKKKEKKKMNCVVLMGRAVRDPEVRYSQDNMAVARFTLAVDRRVKKDNQQSADFISCIAFGKTGEFVEKYIKKGTKVVVDGHWQTGSYKNKEGVTVYTNDCIVDAMEFAESKKENNAPAPQDEIPQEFMNVPDISDEIPFN